VTRLRLLGSTGLGRCDAHLRACATAPAPGRPRRR
jgi:hypothetical protein